MRCHHNIVWRHDWSSKFFIILSFDDCFFLISQQTGNSICIVIRLNLEFYMFTTKITCPLVWIDLPQTHLQICHGHINCLHFLAVWIRLDLYINNSIIFLSANLLLMEHSLVVVCSLVSNYKWWDLVNYWSGGRLLSLFSWESQCFVKWSFTIEGETKRIVKFQGISSEVFCFSPKVCV